MNKPFLYFTKLTGFIPSKIVLKWKTYFLDENIQKTTISPGTIIMSNHKSLWDFPLYIELFFKTPVHFLIAEVIYNKGSFMRWLLKSLGCVKVDRVAFDFSFIDECVGLLKKGENIGIFPEGQLPRNGKMSKFTPSCVMIALAADAPILPVYTDGKYGTGSSVMIGTPVRLRDFCDSENPTKEEISSLNDLLLSKILELEAALERRKG